MLTKRSCSLGWGDHEHNPSLVTRHGLCHTEAMTQTLTRIGDEQTAIEVAEYHHDGVNAEGTRIAAGDHMAWLGSGDHRTVYLDYATDTVYKIGHGRANRREHETLTQARADGADWAPPTTLYEVTIADQWGDTITCTVVAMPYLPEDGSVDHKGLIFAAAGDLNTDNVVANGGQLWLIDAGGMW